MPTRIRKSRYLEYIISPGRIIVPCYLFGISKKSGKAPNIHLVASEKTRMSAKVAKTWYKWSRLYNFLKIMYSTKTPAKAAKIILDIRAKKKLSDKLAIKAAPKAPIIKKEP